MDYINLKEWSYYIIHSEQHIPIELSTKQAFSVLALVHSRLLQYQRDLVGHYTNKVGNQYRLPEVAKAC